MRKVFLSNIILSRLSATRYQSDDFALPNKDYEFMLSYFVDMNIEPGDNVAIITCYTDEETSVANYKKFKEEVETILNAKKANGEFIAVKQNVDFDSLTFSAFFKNIAKLFKDEDIIYMDLTYGMKPYSIGLFIAASYAVKSAVNARVESVVYAQKYKGQGDAEATSISKIYDITSLFYLNEIAGNLHAGEKGSADKMLDLLISDNV